MARLRALFGDYRQNLALVNEGKIRRREVGPHEHERVAESPYLGGLDSEHVAQHPARYVLEVGNALLYVRVVYALKGGYKLVYDARIAVLDVVVFLAEHRECLLHDGDVLEHEYVGVENGGLGLADLCGKLRLQFENVLARLENRRLEPLDFGGLVGVAYLVDGGLELLVQQDEGLAVRDAL